MLMLLTVHETSVLFLVRFALTMGLTRSYSSRPFLCTLESNCARYFSYSQQSYRYPYS